MFRICNARWVPLWIGLTLAGCGGGGGDSGSAPASAPPVVASGSTFPLRAGYVARLTAGASDDFTIAGTCSGTAHIVNAATAAATFEGTTGVGATQTASVTFTNCLPATSTAGGTNYFDANFAPIGASVTGIEYAVIVGAPTTLPVGAKVGDSAVYGTFTTYTDSTKATVTGRRELSYVLEADTASTAILDLAAKTYDTGNRLLLTQQTRYRMIADGSLTLLTIDVQYSITSTVHLIYTKV